MMGIYIMSKQEISDYLKLINKRKDKLKTYVNKEGQINDIDYYIEVMGKYYPDSKPNLVIKLGGDTDG